jgi:hypothetical protein
MCRPPFYFGDMAFNAVRGRELTGLHYLDVPNSNL